MFRTHGNSRLPLGRRHGCAGDWAGAFSVLAVVIEVARAGCQGASTGSAASSSAAREMLSGGAETAALPALGVFVGKSKR